MGHTHYTCHWAVHKPVNKFALLVQADDLSPNWLSLAYLSLVFALKISFSFSLAKLSLALPRT